jgi:hypothetical protein
MTNIMIILKEQVIMIMMLILYKKDKRVLGFYNRTDRI